MKPVFGKKNSQLQRPRVDRFMPPRESFADERRGGSWHSNFPCEPVNIWEAKHQKVRNYKNYLDEVFGLESVKTEVQRPEYQGCIQPWPCIPRRKGYLSSADSILDLPMYSFVAFPELLDWSKLNMLVASLGNRYHMFSWETQQVQGIGRTGYPINCCRFNPSGDLLLIGGKLRMIEVHDAVLNKLVKDNNCKCFVVYNTKTICAITAIDWSPTGNSYVTGCTRGVVMSIDLRMSVINSWRRLSREPVLTLKISPDSRYVAVVILNSPLVHVLVWPSLENHSTLDSNWIIKTIAWHPWRSALLGIGVMTSNLQTSIALWDTPSSRLRETRLGLYNHYSLDVMLFSHVTGELVLSLWDSNGAITFPKASAQLLVMSDPYTVVDQSGEGRNSLDRVRTMVFSPDGTKLATATADEDLIIWNFLPEEEKKTKNKKSKKFHALPVYLDQFTYGFVLR